MTHDIKISTLKRIHLKHLTQHHPRFQTPCSKCLLEIVQSNFETKTEIFLIFFCSVC